MGKDLKKVGIEMNISRVFMSNYIKKVGQVYGDR
jgi:hypothetical protein